MSVNEHDNSKTVLLFELLFGKYITNLFTLCMYAWYVHTILKRITLGAYCTWSVLYSKRKFEAYYIWSVHMINILCMFHCWNTDIWYRQWTIPVRMKKNYKRIYFNLHRNSESYFLDLCRVYSIKILRARWLRMPLFCENTRSNKSI